jgi:hypothetical protein
MIRDVNTLNSIWRKILAKEIKIWVIFKNGTIVVCRDPDKNPREYAIELMKNMGIVFPGSSHGDFMVRALDETPGWVVEYHHPDILSYVSSSELEGEDASDMLVGLIGRKKRGDDAQTLEIIHVEGA